MKTALHHLIAAAILACATSTAAPPDAASIVIDPARGEISQDEHASGAVRAIRVTFPTPMTEMENVRRGGQPSPIVFEPMAEARWRWLSQTEGELTFPVDFVHNNRAGRTMASAAIRLVRHTARLRPGLRDQAGNAVDAKSWGVEFASDRFALRGLEFLNVFEARRDFDHEPGESKTKDPDAEDNRHIQSRELAALLPARPRVRLEFSRDVLPKDLLKLVYFQDSKTNERFPIEVNIEERQSAAPQGWVIVEPAAPLPAGRSYVLVIDRVKDPARGDLLPHLRTIPAGTTYEPLIKYAGGVNQPLKGAFIAVTANQSIAADPANMKLVNIEPAVPGVTIDSTGIGLQVRGKFDIATTYRLTLKAGLLSEDGFRLAKDSEWKISFGPKRPAIVLPERYIFQRASAPAVRCAVVQVNTQPLEWKIAKIPRERFPEVRGRVREFGYFLRDKEENIVSDPQTGEYQYRPTELLIPALQLPVVATGKFPASSGDAETPREVLWEPRDAEPGIFLLEISGRDEKGRAVGNRSIISRGDWMITQIEMEGGPVLRVTNMNDGRPVRGVPLDFIDDEGKSTGLVSTDANGEARVEKLGYEGTILAGAPGRECLQLPGLPAISGSRFYYGGSDRAHTACVIITDRNVYRPGETVMIKGFVRTVTKSIPALPQTREIKLNIEGMGDTFAEGMMKVSERGTFTSEWKTPVNAYGDYYISVDVDGGGECPPVKITVAEFRPPPFSVVTEADVTQGSTAKLRVSSVFFHGVPNAGAKVRWRAEWMVDDWRREWWDLERPLTGDEYEMLRFNLGDEHSPDSAARGFSGDVVGELAKAGWTTSRDDREVSIAATARGEMTLDAQGRAVIECASPFPPAAIYGRAKIYWIVDVTDPATAQTVRGGTPAKVQFVAQVPGVNLEEAGDGKLRVQVRSFDANDQPASGLAVKAEIFRVEMKTVKEKLAADLNRYRNFPDFEKVWEGALVTPAAETVRVGRGGNYVMRVTTPQQPRTPQASDRTMLSSDHEFGVEVTGETSLQVTSERPAYRAGETASITVQSPFAGMATVSVQTDRVLYQRVVELKGSTQRIDVPVQPAFAPNAWVCVHLVKPAPREGVAAERFGSCAISVERPDQQLEVVPSLVSESIEPGAKARGLVKVSVEGRPLAGAEVLLFAVDEAVLALGRWQLPGFDPFRPRRGWGVVTHSAGLGMWTPEKPDMLTHSQKGFILGDAGPIVGGVNFRRQFKALAFWNAALLTNPKGEVSFEFTAPDGLTSYRVVAVAQNGVDQFGSGSAVLKLNKKLQVEPVLPAFLRRGDEVVLRTGVRQDHSESDEVEVAIEVDAGVVLAEPAVKRVSLRRGESVTVGFRAKAAANATQARVRFAARSIRNREFKDGEENSFAVHPAVIERRQTITGTFAAAKPLDVRAAAPAGWLQAEGRCDVVLSGSAFLPKLAGLPAMLEAQGSMEKLSARLLAATLLAGARDFLPRDPELETALRGRINEALKRFSQTVLPDGGLPAWPGADGRVATRNDFVTLQAAWAIRNAMRQDIEVDAKLAKRAAAWLSSAVAAEIGYEEVAPSLRCFALMLLANTASKRELDEMQLGASATEFFNRREEVALDREGRAWLALAMHYLDVMPAERKVLLREIAAPAKQPEFDPATFSSAARTEAICLLARSEIESTNWSKPERQRVVEAFNRISESSVDLSTQENLWLLLVFNSLARGEIPVNMAKRPLTPKPTALSKNNVSAGWLNLSLGQLAQTFAKPLQPGVAGAYLLRATYQAGGDATPGTPGFAIERQMQNLSDPARTGSLEAPWKAGDQILVTYRLNTDRAHSHLELEDQIPACLETVNPQLPLIAEHFKLPVEAGVNALKLSNVELRFARTLLYFEQAPPGRSVYAVVAKVVVPGVFHWPATQARPMYDSRFTGISQAALVHAQ